MRNTALIIRDTVGALRHNAMTREHRLARSAAKKLEAELAATRQRLEPAGAPARSNK